MDRGVSFFQTLRLAGLDSIDVDRGQDEAVEATALQPGQKQRTVLWKVPADYTGYDAGHMPWKEQGSWPLYLL